MKNPVKTPGFVQALIDELRDNRTDDGSQGVEPLDMKRKAAYICKRMKISGKKLEHICWNVGVNTLYDELRKGSGAK